MKIFENQLIQSVFHQTAGDLINRELFVLFYDDGSLLQVAEESDLIRVLLAQISFCPNDKNVRLNPDLAELLHAVLRRLGFQLLRRFQIRNECQVNE